MAKAQKSIKRAATSRKATSLRLPILTETKATLLWLTESKPSPVAAVLTLYPDAHESSEPKVKRALAAAHKEADANRVEMKRREQAVAARFFSPSDRTFGAKTKITSTDDLVLAAASALLTDCANRNGLLEAIIRLATGVDLMDLRDAKRAPAGWPKR